MHEEDKCLWRWIFVSYAIMAVVMYYIVGAMRIW
jgi:anti-sigma-K factor RskA